MTDYSAEIEREERRPTLSRWVYWIGALAIALVLSAAAATNTHDEEQDAADYAKEVIARNTSFSSTHRSTSPSSE